MFTGQYGEKLAANYLLRKGYKLLDKNFKCKLGEIDIVSEKDGSLVIVEVKTRSSDQYGSPVEAVGPRKLTKLKKLAEFYRLNYSKLNKVKIEVVSINLGKKSISLYECIE